MSTQNQEQVTIESLTKSTNKVYKEFFAKNNLVKEWIGKGLIHKTYWRKNNSYNSFSFKEKNIYRIGIPRILIDRFGIQDEVLFITKYLEAISGDGQEWSRITTLHSSSLIALLCFYSISKKNSIEINGYSFEESFFEVKTQVYQDSESNMDVVLRGKDKDGKKVVLFLECKFSEYLSCGQYKGICKETYEKPYKELGLFEGTPIDHVKFENEDEIAIKPLDGKQIYCGGIKQMLSHYIGVSNYSLHRDNALTEHQRFTANPDETVLLGEILFDFGGNITGTKLENYKQAYTSLAKKINNTHKIVMFENALTYQEVFSAESNSNVIKEKNIRNYYALK